MSICIAYQGKLREPGLVPALVRDLTAKAEAIGWPYKTMSQLVAEGLVTCSGLEGITLYPHRECEPLHFHVEREGAFVNHSYYALLEDPEKAKMFRQALAESMALTSQLTERSQKRASRRGKPDGSDSDLHVEIGIPGLPKASGTTFFEEGSRYNWTKTQFAGARVHAAVCALLRYVKQRYSPELEVTDDSGYFVDQDYEKLEAQLAHAGYLVSLVTQAAAAASEADPMTLEAFVDRINHELADAKNKLH